MDIEKLTEKIICKINNVKGKFVNIENISSILKNILGESYTSEISIAVKKYLVDCEGLDFFKEGVWMNKEKSYFCSGNWLAIKGLYENPIEAKEKIGWYSWQTSDDVNWRID
ncbi:hypothetical protein RVS70_05410 [Virgibacillus sp. M23]|uniref:hypothetical protein n=1 Tax=Virgibacillus sp. M23 TaxID=3079030 RepID=UPI002A90CB5B|nr:hypothetical protein [Virgibacillus sp. M23]MDY7043639.1 hypothetical protein [Virgibacillus sp. M23]